MVRDGRDVAISFARTPWWKNDININLLRWQKEISQIEKDASRLLDGRILTVRYEDFVTAPDDTIKEVCAFLDVPFEAGMLEVKNHINYSLYRKSEDDSIYSTAYRSWKDEQRTAFFTDSVFAWKRNKEAVFNPIPEAVKKILKFYGYEVT